MYSLTRDSWTDRRAGISLDDRDDRLALELGVRLRKGIDWMHSSAREGSEPCPVRRAHPIPA